MRRRHVGILLEVMTPIAVVAAWWAWSSAHPSFYFPALPDILDTFRHTWLFDRFGEDVVPSVARLVAGFAVAVVVAVAAGLVLGQSQTARRSAEPIVQFLRAIPPPVLLPFGIVVLGVGSGMKIAIIAFVCIWPILLNTVDGVMGIDPTMQQTARAYGIGGLERQRFVVMPAASPQIFAGIRTGISLALIMMVVSEMVASTNGVGYSVLEAQRSFAIPQMWSGIILLGVLGYVLNLAFTLAERRILRWHAGARMNAMDR